MKNPIISLEKHRIKINMSESNRHAKRNWKKLNPSFSLSKTTLFLSIVFLFLPLIVITFYSFNASKSAKFTEFSFRWYYKLFAKSDRLWDSVINSGIVALSSAAVATALGTLASVGVCWYKFRGKGYIQSVSFLPMVLPEVIMGLSLLVFFTFIKLSLGLLTIFVAHTTFCLPFVYLMVSARIDEFDYSIIEASHDLGANERQTLFKVIIPAIMPGILSGFVMSVTMSLEDYVITSLVSGPGSTTLPIYVYSLIKFGVSPVINALSFVLIFAICTVTVLLRNRLKSFAASR